MPKLTHEPSPPGLTPVVERNIAALLSHRARENRRKPMADRIADRITRFSGSMAFVYLHLALFSGWIAINLGWLPIAPFDPSFVILAMAASVEAIFLSTFVLISQNRMAALADQRADLDLHISLLAEHEITRMLKLLMALSKHVGIDLAHDPELAELARDVSPEAVLERLEASEEG
ncbi:MAG TPA: DUF1003 domain-containing protein [Herpetosiphonaceae bacterium]|nr:DUF1003 domain-containing protein [Herpetosiphonaceae bacterium]